MNAVSYALSGILVCLAIFFHGYLRAHAYNAPNAQAEAEAIYFTCEQSLVPEPRIIRITTVSLRSCFGLNRPRRCRMRINGSTA